MTDRLAGKVAIVTGGAGGIGWSIAGRFLAEGARVAIADIIEPASGLTNGESLFISCDLRSAKQIGHMVSRTIDRFGRIDILVNNAGKTGGSGNFLDVSLEEWQAFIDVNLTGAFLAGQAVARHMVDNDIGGRIINVGSVNSFGAEPEALPYVASKGGIRLLTCGMAVDLARYGITVNMLAPGPIRVGRNAQLFDTEPLASGLARSIPLGSPGRGEDVASAALFFATEESRFVTGASLLVDGGYMSQLKFD